MSNIALPSVAPSVWHFPHPIHLKTPLLQLLEGTANVQKVNG
jgi:hypothetical protein